MTAPFASLPDLVQAAFEADDPHAGAKSLERGHVDSLKGVMASLAAGNPLGFLDFLDPNVEMEIHAPVLFPFIRRARGIPAVRAAIEHNFSVVENQVPALLQLVAQGHLLDATFRESGRLKPTGQPYEILVVQQYQFRDGRIVRFREIAAHATPDD